MGICDGRVVIITGAGRGLGRAHALAFAAEGAKVVVNDVGASLTGEGHDLTPAAEVVAEIKSLGGDAIVNDDDVSDWDGAGRMIKQAIDTFGHLDTLVCNAGIVRDRMIVNMSVDEWDAVMKVHLRGMFCPVRQAVDYWRAMSKAGTPIDARVVTTSSGAGLFGSVSQANYSAAKAGIASFTNIAALEMARYGVTVNAVAPVALTRMTEGLGPAPESDEDREKRSPRWIAPIVTWLASDEAAEVTGRIFEASGDVLAVSEGWVRGPKHAPVDDPTVLGPIVAELLAKARKNSGMDGTPGGWPQPRSK